MVARCSNRSIVIQQNDRDNNGDDDDDDDADESSSHLLKETLVRSDRLPKQNQQRRQQRQQQLQQKRTSLNANKTSGFLQRLKRTLRQGKRINQCQPKSQTLTVVHTRRNEEDNNCDDDDDDDDYYESNEFNEKYHKEWNSIGNSTETTLMTDREGPPIDNNMTSTTTQIDAVSTVSSLLTSSSTKQRRALLKHWKSQMSKGMRKIWKMEPKEEITPDDPGLYIHHPPFHISPSKSVQSVLTDTSLDLPKLDNTNSNNNSIVNTVIPARTITNSTFPLPSYDANQSLVEEIEWDLYGLVRSVSLASLVRPGDASMAVAFDHTQHCAQLVFMPSSSFLGNDDYNDSDDNNDDDDDDTFDFKSYQLDDGPSKEENESDDDCETEIADDKESQWDLSSTDWEVDTVGSDRKPLGAAFSHPSATTYHDTEDDESEDPRPLGIACPPWSMTGTRMSVTHNEDVWSHVEQPPFDDGYITEPPSPTVVERTNNWCGLGQTTLGWSGSQDSDVTMSAFVCNDIPRLPKFPTWKCIADDYPFDEVDQVSKRMPSSLSQRVESLVLTALGQRMDTEDDDDDDYFSQYSAPTKIRHRPKCFCVKCAAQGIYEDLIRKSGGSVDK